MIINVKEYKKRITPENKEQDFLHGFLIQELRKI